VITLSVFEIREISKFPGYGVSNDGQFWSRGKSCEWQLLKQWKSDGGRWLIGFMRDGKQHKFLAHRLVLEAFKGPCPDGMECCHNDGNPLNNEIENLRWGTKLENMADKLKHGTDSRGEKCYKAILTTEAVLEIWKDLKAKTLTLKEIGAKHGVSKSAIGNILYGNAWKHVKPV
jgi:hypothetical protein